MLKTVSILLFGTILGAALLTPLVYSGIEGLFGQNIWPFSRVFDRVAMAAALVLIIVLRREFHIVEVKNLFITLPKKVALRHFLIGLCLTLFSVVLMLPVLILVTHSVAWAPQDLYTIVRKAFKAIFAAAIISVIEEVFFRILILQKLKELTSRYTAIFCCSLLYASVHFISPVKTWEYPGFSLWAGFAYIGVVLDNIFQLPILWAGFGLFLVGVVLCLSIEKYRSIYLCIGMHAGWVAAIKFTRLIGEFNMEASALTGQNTQHFLVSLPEAWISIILVGIIALKLNLGSSPNQSRNIQGVI